MPKTKESGTDLKWLISKPPWTLSLTEGQQLTDGVSALLVERDALQTRLELIARNAESWHHDDEAKQRALNVIAAWARGNEIPAVLVADLERRP